MFGLKRSCLFIIFGKEGGAKIIVAKLPFAPALVPPDLTLGVHGCVYPWVPQTHWNLKSSSRVLPRNCPTWPAVAVGCWRNSKAEDQSEEEEAQDSHPEQDKQIYWAMHGCCCCVLGTVGTATLQRGWGTCMLVALARRGPARLRGSAAVFRRQQKSRTSSSWQETGKYYGHHEKSKQTQN